MPRRAPLSRTALRTVHERLEARDHQAHEGRHALFVPLLGLGRPHGPSPAVVGAVGRRRLLLLLLRGDGVVDELSQLAHKLLFMGVENSVRLLVSDRTVQAAAVPEWCCAPRSGHRRTCC